MNKRYYLIPIFLAILILCGIAVTTYSNYTTLTKNAAVSTLDDIKANGEPMPPSRRVRKLPHTSKDGDGVVPLIVSASAYAGRVVILDTEVGYIVSKDSPTKVVLKGRKKDDSPYSSNIFIELYDKDGKLINTIKPSTNEGYGADILLADFIGNGLNQIYLAMSSGGSGGFGYYYIYDAFNNEIRTIFDYEQFSKENVFSGRYLDNYQAEVVSANGTSRYVIDLSGRPQDYKDMIWNSEGKLLSPKPIDISGTNTVFPYYNSYTGTYQLLVYQRITGLYNADVLGYVITQLAYQHGNFGQLSQGLMIFPF